MNHPLAYFQKIYVINLAARSDRRREMDEQLHLIGLNLAHPLVRLFTAVRPADAGGFPGLGARGCFMSHLNVLRSAQAGKLKRVLIFEDDLNFAADFNERIDTTVAGLADGDWGMFYGGYRVETPPAPDPATELAAVAADFPVRTTHFVAFSAPAVAAAVEHLEAMLLRPPGDLRGGPMHVDGAYNWFRRQHPQFPTLLAVPELGYQRHSRTDVHHLKWFDQFPVTRGAAAWWRRLRNA